MTECVRDVRDTSTEPDQRPTARWTISFLSLLAKVMSVPALLAGVAIPINQGTQTGATIAVAVQGAAAALLSRADLNLPPGLLVSAPGLGIALSPLLVAAGLFVLAEVFRRGRLMSRDVEGLV